MFEINAIERNSLQNLNTENEIENLGINDVIYQLELFHDHLPRLLRIKSKQVVPDTQSALAVCVWPVFFMMKKHDDRMRSGPSCFMLEKN